MDEVIVRLEFSGPVEDADRTEIAQSFIAEGLTTEVAQDGVNKSVDVPPHLFIDLVMMVGTWEFLRGFANKAGEDAWEAIKRAFSNRRSMLSGGEEMFLKEDDETKGRYILPADQAQWKAALDALPADFKQLQSNEERYWLGAPASRWGTGMELIEHGKQGHK